MIAAIIADCDGTLADTLDIWSRLAADDLRARGVEPSPALNAELATCTLRQGADYICEVYGLTCGSERLMADWQLRLADYYAYEAEAAAGARPFLEACAARQIPVLCATISPEALVRPLLTRTGLAPLLSGLLCGHDLRIGKDEPTLFELALAQLGTPRRATWVMEDSLFAVQTAKAAGFPTLAVRDRHHSAAHWQSLKETATAYAEHLQDALAWLEARSAPPA